MSKRAERRHHKERMKARARKAQVNQHMNWCSQCIEVAPRAHYMADHLKMCSCDGCCNPRHSIYCQGEEKFPMQERRRRIDAQQQEDEFDGR